MFNTISEIEQFINTRPDKWKVTKEIQEQKDTIKRLESISVEAGLENSRISNSYKKNNGVWTPHEEWTKKDQLIFKQNNQKKLDIQNEIKIRKEIIKRLEQYKPMEYIQMGFDFKGLNERLIKKSKFLYESKDYKLTIITGRDRDFDGVLQNMTINAENDLEALLYVFKNYDLQNAGMFNGDYEEEDLTEEDKQLKQNILNCVKENKIEEGVKLLTDLYFDNFDISDYYANIVKLEAPDGHIVFEDKDLDYGDMYDNGIPAPDEDEEDDNETILINMFTEALNMLQANYTLSNEQRFDEFWKLDIVPFIDGKEQPDNKLGWIQIHVKDGYTAVKFGELKDKLINGTAGQLKDWLDRQFK